LVTWVTQYPDMPRLTRLLVATSAAFIAMAGLVHAADQPLAGSATLVNQANLPKVATLPQFVEGGFSALYPVTGEPNHFWTVSDRGPNGDTFGTPVKRPFPAPAFTPSIYKVSVDTATQQLEILERIPLKLSAGNVDPVRAAVGGPSDQITGFGNIGATPLANVPVADEVPVSDSNADGFVNATDVPFSFDPYGLDTEGIVFDPRGSGSFWLVDEYRPSIIHIALDGTLLQRYTPAGQNASNLGASWSAVPLNDVLPAIYSLRRDNRGFEGVAISPDGLTLYAVVQNPLGIPNATCNAVTGYAGGNNSRSATRIAKLDISNPAAPVLIGDFIYTLDVDASEVTFTDLRISDLYWVGPDKLLVDERDDVGLVRRFIYEADLSAATNLQSPGPGVDVSCIDTLKPSAVAARGVVVATKAAKLDLASTSASPAYPYDKVEGLVKLASGNFALIDDNDFQAVYNPATGGFTLSTKPTQYLEYGVVLPPEVPESALVPLLALTGIVTGGFALVVRRRATLR
jgi:hypothetical protein